MVSYIMETPNFALTIQAGGLGTLELSGCSYPDERESRLMKEDAGT